MLEEIKFDETEISKRQKGIDDIQE